MGNSWSQSDRIQNLEARLDEAQKENHSLSVLIVDQKLQIKDLQRELRRLRKASRGLTAESESTQSNDAQLHWTVPPPCDRAGTMPELLQYKPISMPHFSRANLGVTTTTATAPAQPTLATCTSTVSTTRKSAGEESGLLSKIPDFLLKLEGGEDESMSCISQNATNSAETQYAMITSADALFSLLSDPAFHDESSPLFHKLKSLVVSLPTRQMLRVFWRQVICEAITEDEKARLVQVARTGEYTLSRDGDAILFKYTSSPNWYCTRINLLLALDKLDREYSNYVKQLNHCIIYQTPKFSGKVYRGALHCPMEIFIFAFKQKFYIPSFTSTSISFEHCFWDPWDDKKTQKNLQNIMFEIDISNYNTRSTLIKPHQTRYEEKECLLSCYNIFEWAGYTYDAKANIPLVKLRLLSYEEYHDTEKGCLRDTRHGDIPVIWLEKRGEIPRTRNMSPEQMDFNLKQLFESYHRNCRRERGWMTLDWLNATFSPRI